MNSTSEINSRPKGAKLILFIIIFTLIAFAIFGIHSRMEARAALLNKIQDNAALSVNIVMPTTGNVEELVLPADLEAFSDAPIYARTNGYLKRWLVDIGSHVKSGQLLAEIDTPEADQLLLQAEADLATAQANYDLAQKTAIRWKGLVKTNAVSKQSADEKEGDADAKVATLASAKANYKRLIELQKFKNIVAPFDGVVTVRNIDVGDLVVAGNAGTPKELFHISSTEKLRVYVNVPEVNAMNMQPGIDAQVQLQEYPGKNIAAKLVRTANALDSKTRTMKVELEINNGDYKLLPGAYAEVHFKLPTNNTILRVPSNALLFRSNGLNLVTISATGEAELNSVSAGRDFGTEIEVIAGLPAGKAVVINPPDSIASGQKLITSASVK